jgi:hypothetical protein
VDKALESCLSEEIQGYVLASRLSIGWDAALALILALDRDHRALLERILRRCAALNRECLDDLERLAGILTAEEALAEDVEAEREARRGQLGHVEPRAARAFLELARARDCGGALERDPITHAYFRELSPDSAARQERSSEASAPLALLDASGEAEALLPAPGLEGSIGRATPDAATPFLEAMHLLNDEAPGRYADRMEELAYLANVLLAGASVDGRRLRPAEAAEAALATVALGAEIEVRQRGAGRSRPRRPATAGELSAVLRDCPADPLFRAASATLASALSAAEGRTFLRSRGELDAALRR